MSLSPLLLLHIASGTSGMLSGFVAMAFRKGSRQHGLAGDVFVTSMLILSATWVLLAAMKFQPGNILGGTLTFYLVATAWMSAKRAEAGTSIFDWVALLAALAVTASQITFGLEAAFSPTGLKYGYPPGPYFFLGSSACLRSRGTFACSCAEAFLAHNGSRGTFGACALPGLLRQPPFSWHGHTYSPPCCARPAYLCS